MGQLYGKLDAPAGWLEKWIDAHVASRELRVLRWNHERPKGDAWPFGYAMPTEDDWRFFTGIFETDTLRVRKATC